MKATNFRLLDISKGTIVNLTSSLFTILQVAVWLEIYDADVCQQLSVALSCLRCTWIANIAVTISDVGCLYYRLMIIKAFGSFLKTSCM